MLQYVIVLIPGLGFTVKLNRIRRKIRATITATMEESAYWQASTRNQLVSVHQIGLDLGVTIETVVSNIASTEEHAFYIQNQTWNPSASKFN
jgi:hypothetical protein